ncbi:MAG TPA: protein-L-isoaspartate(D-aspartate) O-methyltransferase [Thermopetrobacter sp.]|nr:protein-L-isoaspartate(D-aspartate) O-methyltransferase [Thermopetrobacter sp.]
MTDQSTIARLIMTLRRHGIRDTRVLQAMEETPREMFVEAAFRDQAWADTALPIACGQTISQPYIVAYMTEQLEVTPTSRVLEVGTGSGYQAAVLARLARRVYTIERHRDLLEQAKRRFAALRLSNIETRVGDGHRGWPEAAPFDRIIVTAAAAHPPAALLDQLAEDGVMVIPLDAGAMHQELVRIRRTPGGFSRERLIPVRFVPMLKGVGRRGKRG